MNDFLILTIASTFVGILIPNTKETGIKKAVAVLAALTLILAIAVPVSEAIGAVTSFPTYFVSRLLPDEETLLELEADGREWVTRYSIDTIESDTATLVESRYGLQSGSVTVQAFTDTDTDGLLHLTNVSVSVPAYHFADSGEVEAYVKGILSCPCKVVVCGESRIKEEW